MGILSNWTVDEAGQGMRYALFCGIRGQLSHEVKNTAYGLDEGMNY
jgi:hypothetical protein